MQYLFNTMNLEQNVALNKCGKSIVNLAIAKYSAFVPLKSTSEVNSKVSDL